MKKYEIRFLLTEEVYRRVKARADRYAEPVGCYARHILLDRVEALETAETRKSWRKPNDPLN